MIKKQFTFILITIYKQKIIPKPTSQQNDYIFDYILIIILS